MQSKELNELLQRHKADILSFWKQFAAFAVLDFVVVFGLVFASVHFGLYVESTDWKITAALFWFILLIPPFKMMYPEKPTEELVELNKVLNEIGRRVNSSKI